MTSHAYPYVRTERYCHCCGEQTPALRGYWCQKKRCQEAKVKHKKEVEKAWVKKNKPWRKKKEQVDEPMPNPVVRYCKYRFCSHPEERLPAGYFLYHPECHKRLSEIHGGGIDIAEGGGLPLREGD